MRDSLTGSSVAGEEICRQARRRYERELHYDPCGWHRPVERVRRLFQLSEMISTNREQDRQSMSDEQEYAELCRELGVMEPFHNPDQHVIMEIAQAIADGASPSPQSPPEGWAEGKRWLRQPKAWDPDQYVFEVVARHLDDAEHLLRAREETRLRLAWCIEIALDVDRTTLEDVLRMASEKYLQIAGTTKALVEDLMPEGCSPVRWKLASRGRWSVASVDSDVREAFVSRVADGEKGVESANDLAEALTAIEFDQLDAYLLRIASALVNTLPPSGSRRRRKKGRRQEYVPSEDKKLIGDWKTSGMQKGEFERERGLDANAVKRAQDREKRRLHRGSD